ncbi:hypothetical protein GDN83_16770 [Gordonia jinghuaiqii]|uniref:Uncharacterized protein n=1 Tax=Gordonia jinghuaiqii TaxID=2758710 RepID=A0A7D7QP16_9ACTN|nr:hypothetical protein [Gordonia jinghuaiqii]MCR5979363.1 hypothetical protein [Gordonia jinghuaiqii]QMT01146.1 hypothetical protein H1R19_20180 [Gordonia jinghuaiqii]
MWRQVIGFAVFGGIVATFGAAMARGSSPSGVADFGMVWGSGYSTSFGGVSGGGSALVVAAVVGAVVGLLGACLLWVVGLRVTAPTGAYIGRVVAAGLIGVALGLTPTLILLATSFAGDSGGDVPYLLIYAISAVLGYGLGVAAVFGVLRASGDGLIRATVIATAIVLPVGGCAATFAGAGVAGWLGYTTTTSTWVATILVVVMVLAATFAIARGWALGRDPGRPVEIP